MLGIFWRRTNTPGSLIGFLTGGAFALLMVIKINVFFLIGWWSFVVTLVVTVIATLLTKPPKTEKVEGLTWESDFHAKVGFIAEARAANNGTHVTQMPDIKVALPPWYLNLKYWATAILLVQIALLLFFG
jgi:Na+/proline symporter